MRVIPITADNPSPMTGLGTNTYLIPGVRPTLVDAADPGEAYVNRVAEALEAVQPGAQLAQVVVTHAHADHVSGVEAVARRWPGAAFAKIPDPGRDAKHAVPWTPLRDDQAIEAGDGALWVLHTPGHSPDHAAFLDLRSSVLFCGDLLVNGGTVTIPVSAGGDLAQYMRSLRRLLEAQPRRIYPGHGPPVDNPAALIRGYIGHRVAREMQILQELSSGPLSEPALLARVYRDLADELRPAALENVRAHLYKLRDEGKVQESGGRWASS